MAESVGASFVNESNFQIEGKWYILSKNSLFEVCSTVSLDINGLLAGISDFGEDIVSEASSDSSGISPSNDGRKSSMDSDYITEPSNISAISSSFTPKRVVAILYSRDSNCKAYNYHKVAGDNF